MKMGRNGLLITGLVFLFALFVSGCGGGGGSGGGPTPSPTPPSPTPGTGTTWTSFLTYSEYTEQSGNASSPEDSNSYNDDISLAEDAGALPKKITGTFYAVDSNNNLRGDIDYYALNFDQAGKYTVLVVSDINNMDITVAAMDANADSLKSIPYSDQNVANSEARLAFTVPSSGTYYISVTGTVPGGNSSDPSYAYTMYVYADSDGDGVPDDVEDRINSDKNAYDSDNDSISDFQEFFACNNVDADSDGIYNCMDTDSDGDNISDYTEGTGDVDNDNLPNYLDTDSDGNGVSDSTEAVSPQSPRDLDEDGTPDYLDMDNDNDGLTDINDPNPNELPQSASITSLVIYNIHNLTRNTDDVFAEGDNAVISGDGFDSSSLVFIESNGKTTQVNATIISANEITFTFPALSADENATIYVYSPIIEKSSNNFNITILSSTNNPIITRAIYNATTTKVEIYGENFENSMNVYFQDNLTATGTYNAAGYLEVTPPAGAKSGYIYVENSQGATSNSYYLQLTSALNGSVTLPSGATINYTDLVAGYGINDLVSISLTGNFFNANADITNPSIITVFYSSSGAYYSYLKAVVLPAEANINIDVQTTAVALIWESMQLGSNVEEANWDTARTTLSNLQEITDLASYIETQLASDPTYLTINVWNDATYQQKFDTAYSAAETALQNANLLLSPQKINSIALQNLAPIIDPTEQEDVYVYDVNGNVQIKNRRRLYMSAKIISAKGDVLTEHARGYFSPEMIGPETSLLSILYRWGNIKQYNQPHYKDCLIEVVTPGLESPAGDSSVVNYLRFRTIVDQAIWPVLSIALDKISIGDVTKILISQAPNAIAQTNSLIQQGDILGGIGYLVGVIWNDVYGSLTTGNIGPITKALATKIAEKTGKSLTQSLLEDLCKKVASTLIPGVGSLKRAVEIAGIASNAAGVGAVAYDMANTPGKLKFKVDYPLEITQVVPSKIIPDGNDKTFVIYGKGFEVMTAGIIFTTEIIPKVTFSDPSGKSFTVTDPYVFMQGTRMRVVISGSFFEGLNGPLSVKVQHGENYSQEATLNDAVEITNQVELTSLTPQTAAPGDAIRIYGTGFVKDINAIEVHIGGYNAEVTMAQDTFVTVIVPQDITTGGSYEVKARVNVGGQWTNWSNSLTLNIALSSVTITVSDSGTLKDDAFALYVDGKYIFTLYANDNNYTKSATLNLTPGQHVVKLVGVLAPDDIGTYSISFSGCTIISGPATTGEDLIAGATKIWTIEVPQP